MSSWSQFLKVWKFSAISVYNYIPTNHPDIHIDTRKYNTHIHRQTQSHANNYIPLPLLSLSLSRLLTHTSAGVGRKRSNKFACSSLISTPLALVTSQAVWTRDFPATSVRRRQDERLQFLAPCAVRISANEHNKWVLISLKAFLFVLGLDSLLAAVGSTWRSLAILCFEQLPSDPLRGHYD